MEFLTNTKFDFLGKAPLFVGASLVLTAAGLISLAVKGGPRYGIDFRGGATVEVRFAQQPTIEQVRTAVSQRVKGNVEVVEVVGRPEINISVEQQSDAELQQARNNINQALKANFGGAALADDQDLNNIGKDALASRLRGPLQAAVSNMGEQQVQDLADAILKFRNAPEQSGLLKSFDQLSAVPGMTPQVLAVVKKEMGLSGYHIRQAEVVGPKVGKELQRQAVLATLYALGAMLIYIAFRFEWIYGVAAVLAVFHDTIITIGLFSLTDKEISLTVVAALLTLVGYSMNDTIVVFDRIRENLKVSRREPMRDLINRSINETLSRTIMVSGLTLLTALALWIFGGPVLNGFSFALVVGILVGTYSSIFIASPLLVWWQKFADSRKRGGAAASASAR